MCAEGKELYFMKLIQGVVNQVNSLKISQRDSLCFELLQYITQNQFLQKNEESCQEIKKVLG
jgi:predicted XRE-type DNA-binding protein